MFAATGVTSGAMLRGVRRSGQGAVTHSVVMRSQSGTVRYIEAHHNFAHQDLGARSERARVDARPVARRHAQPERPALGVARTAEDRARPRHRPAAGAAGDRRPAAGGARRRDRGGGRLPGTDAARAAARSVAADRHGCGGGAAGATPCARGETVGVFGDYDVDGACSRALMVTLAARAGLHGAYPRAATALTEGYGPNAPALRGAGGARRHADRLRRLRHRRRRGAGRVCMARPM